MGTEVVEDSGCVVIVFLSHRSPLNPEGHSHLKDPSSFNRDLHKPPFSHVFGFFSQ